jgi:tetratricopeptide (TPR) repeat protein
MHNPMTVDIPVIAALVAVVVLLLLVSLFWLRRSRKQRNGPETERSEPAVTLPEADESVLAAADQPTPAVDAPPEVDDLEGELVEEPFFELEPEPIEVSEAVIEPVAVEPIAGENLADSPAVREDVSPRPAQKKAKGQARPARKKPVVAAVPAEEEAVDLDFSADEEEEEPISTAADSAISLDLDRDLVAQKVVEPAPVELEPEPEPVAEPESEPERDEAAGLAFTEASYTAWLSALDVERRGRLAQVAGQESKRSDIQRELVVINDRLARLSESFKAEVALRAAALSTLDQFRDQVGRSTWQAARQALQQGDCRLAEALFDGQIDSDGPGDGEAAFMSGQLAESRVAMRKAMKRYEQAVTLDQDNPQYLRAAGVMARRLYRYREAVHWLTALVRRLREADAEVSVDTALAMRELAYTYVVSGQYKKAGPLYKQAMTVLARHLGPEHPEMALSWFQIGELQETLGEYDKAIALFKKTLRLLEGAWGEKHQGLAPVLDKLAGLCVELDLEAESVPLYERLVALRQETLPSTHPLLAITLNALAESYRLQGQYAKAEACYRRSLKITEIINGADHPTVAAILQELAKLCRQQHKTQEADLLQEQAMEIFEQAMQRSATS